MVCVGEHSPVGYGHVGISNWSKHLWKWHHNRYSVPNSGWHALHKRRGKHNLWSKVWHLLSGFGAGKSRDQVQSLSIQSQVCEVPYEKYVTIFAPFSIAIDSLYIWVAKAQFSILNSDLRMDNSFVMFWIHGWCLGVVVERVSILSNRNASSHWKDLQNF